MGAAIQLGQGDQQGSIGRWIIQPRQECLAALVAGFAAGNAQLYQSLLGEQRQAVTGIMQLTPLKAAVDMKYQPLFAAGVAAGLTDQVGRFSGQ